MTRAERFSLLTQASSTRDIGGRSARAAILSASTGMVDFGVRIVSTAILARLLLPEHFGLVMMISAVTAIADQLKDVGLSVATVQRKEISHEEVTNLFWINVAISVMLATALCACAPLIAEYYRDPRLVLPTCVLASNFLWGGLMIQHQALLTRQLKFGRTSGVRLGSSILSTLLAIFLAWQGWGFWALVWRECARSILLTIGMWLCMPWLPCWPYWRTSVAPLLNFGMQLSAANVFGSIASGADRFFLGRAQGAGSVALFRQSYQLLLVPMDQLLSPLFQVSTPGLSTLQADVERYKRYYLKLLTLVCLATMPASAFAAIYASEITHILLGHKWIDCTPVITILCLSVFIKQPVESTYMVLITRRQPKQYLVISLIQNAGFVIAVLIGTHWGTIGVAWADVILTYILAAPKIGFALKGSPVRMSDYFKTICRPALSSLGMAATLYASRVAFPTSSGPLILVFGAALASSIFIVVWLLLPGGKGELRNLISDFRSTLSRKKNNGAPHKASGQASQA